MQDEAIIRPFHCQRQSFKIVSLASVSNVTSIWGTPRGAGGIPVSSVGDVCACHLVACHLLHGCRNLHHQGECHQRLSRPQRRRWSRRGNHRRYHHRDRRQWSGTRPSSSVGNSSDGTRPVDDWEDIETGDRSGVYCWLALSVVEVLVNCSWVALWHSRADGVGDPFILSPK